MSQKALLLTVFWVFIAVMLLKQAYDYNQKVTLEAAHGKPAHYFYDMPHADSNTQSSQANAGLKAAKVIQESYWVSSDSSTSTFICHVVAKNLGNAKAIGIEYKVRPYYGSVDTSTRGNGYKGPMGDSNPMSQINEVLQLPDLAPGESTTQEVSFPVRPELRPGGNPNPEIIFQTEKNP